MVRSARIGIDVGGTFTDFVLHDAARGVTHTGKRLTTPEAPSRAIIEGLERLLRESDTPIACVSSIVHGTTLATNTLLERTGARIGLITTEGFRDVLEMGREIRFDVEDLYARQAPVLVPRRRRLGVVGRITADGREHAPLDEDGVAAAARQLIDGDRVEALVISFLHAYANPVHELRAREIVHAADPQMLVTVSSEVAPEIGEYERTATACVNAYVQPRMRAHLAQLEEELQAMGFGGQLLLMLSSGGLTTIDHAKAFPVKLLESGPAAGAIAAAFLARQADEPRVISFDMGGTTAKLSLIENGLPRRTHTFEAGRVDKFKPGSGLPLRLTVIDMIEIGSGGGSVAAVDDLGLMTVGPRSAGSVPGPVAYGRGGEEPTVTDSDLVVGYLDPESFLGGEMPLEVAELEDVIDRTLGRPLGLNARQAATGVQEVVTESMAAAARAHLAEKGSDPGAHTLFAFGGAGPVHAYALAKRLKIRRILVPAGAGVISALGFLIAAPTVDAVRGYQSSLDAADWERAAWLLREMEDEARELLAAAGADDSRITVKRSADMRYVGQGYQVEVELPAVDLDGSPQEAILQAFRDVYRATFGRTIDDARAEIVSWRCSATASESEIRLSSGVREADARLGSRRIDFPGFGGIDTPVYDRYALGPETSIRGPAAFHELHSSCAFGPDCIVTIDESFNLVADIERSGEHSEHPA
jgi:N-methylhydantoinase A